MARNVVIRIALDVVVALLASTTVNARDLGQWDDPANADLKRWYQDLKQPDNPAVSCCGEADAYWADAFEATSDGQYVAIITDPRDDEPLGRRHRDIGTRIVVPKNKIKWNEGNPVGHGIIFLNRADSVFCYLPPLGNLSPKARSPGTEFLDAETGRQKSRLKFVNAHRDQSPENRWPEIPAKTPYPASYRELAVCEDLMVGAPGLEPGTR